MVKIALTFILMVLSFGVSFAFENVNSLIPKGHQPGNGYVNDILPYYFETNLSWDNSKELVLHYSHKKKGEPYPDKQIISMFKKSNGADLKIWEICFDNYEEIDFLIDDINKDGKKEMIVHGLHSGTGACGNLWLYQLGEKVPRKIFGKSVEGEGYILGANGQKSNLDHDFFPDLDKDGIVEILVGYRGESNHASSVDSPFWFDVYKWNGKSYFLADDQFPGFYKEELSGYKQLVKEKGETELLREYIKRAKNFAGI